MAFKMSYGKGSFPFKDTGHGDTDPKHKHEKKIGNKPGAEMTELNSSAEMRRLDALPRTEYKTDKNNAEWQRRRDLNKARQKYTKSLGAPTGDDVMASEERRVQEQK